MSDLPSHPFPPNHTALSKHHCTLHVTPDLPCQVVVGLVQGAAYPPACLPWRQRSCSGCLPHQVEALLQAPLAGLHLQVRAGDVFVSMGVLTLFSLGTAYHEVILWHTCRHAGKGGTTHHGETSCGPVLPGGTGAAGGGCNSVVGTLCFHHSFETGLACSWCSSVIDTCMTQI
jgi:hypothetical protein